MSSMDQEVQIQDTVIQQVLLTSFPSPLPMMEYNVTGEMLKPDGQKEDDAAPPVALWGSWLYRS